jgi:hypothetical protein
MIQDLIRTRHFCRPAETENGRLWKIRFFSFARNTSRTMALEIAVLKNEIALYECHSEAAKVNGDIEMQRLLLATITATRNNLLHLEKRLEKQGNRNQSAMSRGIKGTPFSSKLLEQRNKFNS